MSAPATLGNWLEIRLTALIRAENEDSFNAAFDALYSPKLTTIVYNGMSGITTDEYKEQLKAMYSVGAKSSAVVTFQDMVEVPSEMADKTRVSPWFEFG